MLAVLLYSELSPSQNPDNIPGVWPCEVKALADGENAASGWLTMTQAEYSAYVATHRDTYHAWYTAYQTAQTSTIMINTIKNKIINAMNFGRDLIADYGAQNTLSGYNIEQIKSIVVATAGVQAAISTGSLYVALDELTKVVPDGTLITEAKLAFFRNRIQDYLGMPRT